MWITEWRAIIRRIGGIREAAIFFLRADTGEEHNSAGEIIQNVHATVLQIARFSEIYGVLLPSEAHSRLVAFSNAIKTPSQGSVRLGSLGRVLTTVQWPCTHILLHFALSSII